MKDKILEQVRLLYNKHGLNVTTRMICDHMNISLGSYSYHFKQKKLLVQSLYQQMQAELLAVYETLQEVTPTIEIYLETHQRVFLIQEKFQFFYLNLFEILNGYPDVKAAFHESVQQERAMARQSFQRFMDLGILKKGISNEIIERLINVGQVLNNFWLLDHQLSEKRSHKQRMKHYIKLCCGLLEPYLENSSKAAYDQFFQQLEH